MTDAYKKLMSDIEEVRRDLSGEVKLPFASYEAAVAWIDQQALALDAHERDPKRGEELRERIDHLAADFTDYLGQPVTVRLEVATLTYLKSGTQMEIVTRIPVGSPLAKLHAFVKRAAEDTPLSEAQLVAYVLAGVNETPKGT